MSIYKACDIRGRVETELSPELYERWGRHLGRQLGPGRAIVVGGDGRGSTPGFLRALERGLVAAGTEVLALGQCPTPLIYFAKRHLGAPGCAMVTASHNPASINGLKWMLGDQPPTPEAVQALAAEPVSHSGPAGTVRPVAIESAYRADLARHFPEGAASRLRVVLDPMHGAWAERAGPYLQALFPQCVFESMRDAPDPEFAGILPDCARPGALTDLGQRVRASRADLGIAFDGDGDRVAFVDADGVPLRAEEAVFVLLHVFGAQWAGESFVYDLKFSSLVPETARQLGANPLVERSGHAFIRQRMLATGSLFGAEISGHYFYRALAGGDDGLYSACRMLDFLGRGSTTLADWRRLCPPIFLTPDLRLPVAPDHQAEILARIRSAWADVPQSTLDGVRIETPDGWILVRSSVTEPALTLRAEGRDAAALARLLERFAQSMPEFQAVIRSAFPLPAPPAPA